MGGFVRSVLLWRCLLFLEAAIERRRRVKREHKKLIRAKREAVIIRKPAVRRIRRQGEEELGYCRERQGGGGEVIRWRAHQNEAGRKIEVIYVESVRCHHEKRQRENQSGWVFPADANAETTGRSPGSILCSRLCSKTAST